MRFLLVFVFWVFIFVGDVWAPPPPFEEAEERWDEHGKNDDGTWWGITNGVRYEGVSICAAQGGAYGLEKQNDIDVTAGSNCWCKITSPFDGMYVFFADYSYEGVSCEIHCDCGSEAGIEPAGVYRSAYETMKLHNALLNSQKEKLAACHLKTSTGLSLPLYDVKSTSPALHVLRDGVVYYGNMELGQGTNTLNVDYNEAIYHLVE